MQTTLFHDTFHELTLAGPMLLALTPTAFHHNGGWSGIAFHRGAIHRTSKPLASASLLYPAPLLQEKKGKGYLPTCFRPRQQHVTGTLPSSGADWRCHKPARAN